VSRCQRNAPFMISIIFGLQNYKNNDNPSPINCAEFKPWPRDDILFIRSGEVPLDIVIPVLSLSLFPLAIGQGKINPL